MTEQPAPDVVIAICANCGERRPRQALMFHSEYMEDGLRYAGFRCKNCGLEVQPTYLGLYLENGVVISYGSHITLEGAKLHAYRAD